MTEATAASPTATPRSQAPLGDMSKRSAFASFLGATLEYYDFVLYGTASALVFNHLFFAKGDPAAATIASLATFGVAYVARPIGGLVMSHVGDKLGRKLSLMITLLVMGCSSFAIGLLPTYESVGIWATVLLLVCRIAQGFSAGAEAAGASTLTMEHAPAGRRAFFTSFTMMGCSAGNVLASLVFLPFTMMPGDVLMSWGWRVPFLLSSVVLLVAYFVRSKLEETESFEETKETGSIQAVPAAGVLKHQWADVLRVFFITFYSVLQSITMVYALNYATGVVGLSRSTMLLVNASAMAVSMAVIPWLANIADRIGRKPVLLVGAAGCVVSIFFYFQALHSGNWFWIFALCIINQGLFYSCWNAVWTVFFPEMFAAPFRFTGMAMGNQLGLVLVGFSPSIAAWIEPHYGWLGVVVFVIVAVVIGSIAIATAKETAFVPLKDLGNEAIARQIRRREAALQAGEVAPEEIEKVA